MILLDVAKKLKEGEYEDVPTADLVNVLRDGFEEIKKLALEEGEGFTLQVPKFGTFKVKKQQAKTGFNPQTKKKIKIPAKLAFKLQASSVFKGELAEIKVSSSEKKKTKKKKKKK